MDTEPTLLSTIISYVICFGVVFFVYWLVDKFLSIPSDDNLEKIFPWMKE